MRTIYVTYVGAHTFSKKMAETALCKHLREVLPTCDRDHILHTYSIIFYGRKRIDILRLSKTQK